MSRLVLALALLALTGCATLARLTAARDFEPSWECGEPAAAAARSLKIALSTSSDIDGYGRAHYDARVRSRSSSRRARRFHPGRTPPRHKEPTHG